jgi:hypothetical protein
LAYENSKGGIMPENCSHTFSAIVEMPNAYINGDRDEDVVYCEICLKTFEVSDYFDEY